MIINRTWLENHHACDAGKEWFVAQGITAPVAGIKNLLKHEKEDWANWLVVRLMTHKQKTRYAIYAAKQVLKIFEQMFPTDKRPRLAIEAALRCVNRNTQVNRNAAANAAADAAAYAAANAAADAANAAARQQMKRKIILYGIRLLTHKGGR